MKQAGQVVLFGFPQADLEAGKLRPALLLGKLPSKYDDWLICMISGQTRQYINQFDELVQEDDSDFAESGLRKPVLFELDGLLWLKVKSWLEQSGKFRQNGLHGLSNS